MVVLTAAGAVIALHSYNNTFRRDPQKLDRVVFGVKQGAGVLGAICSAVFSVITALQTARLVMAPPGQQQNPPGVPNQWGKRGQDARVIDIVDRVG